MPQPRPPVTYASLCSLFISHLTIAIHTILSARAIYPSSTFLTAKAYNIPVRQSRHPGVCAWINDAVAAVEAELLKGVVKRVVLVIFESERVSDAEAGVVGAGRGEPRSTSSADVTVTDMASSSEHERERERRALEKEPQPKRAKTGGNRPLERYLWDVARLPTVPKAELNTPFIRQEGNAASAPSNPNPSASGLPPDAPTTAQMAAKRHADIEQAHIDVQEQFRGLLARLSTISSRLRPLPPDCTYTLCVELKDEADPPIGHPQPWIPVESGLQNEILHGGEVEEEEEERETVAGGKPRRRTKKGDELGGAKTVPVRTVDAGEMLFEMWIEEGKAKFDGK